MRATLEPHELASTRGTELSEAALELLPLDWQQRSAPWVTDDVTTFHSYTLTPRSAPKHVTRTWLIHEIDDLAERVTTVATPIEAFADPEWDLPTPDRPGAGSAPLRLHVVHAVDRLMEALTLSEVRVAELAGISRNSIRNWRNGQDAYPATVKRLLQLANLVSSLESSLGRQTLAMWLEGRGRGVMSRRELLAEPDGPTAVARQAAEILFGMPDSALPALELLELESPETSEGENSVGLYSARPRRPSPDAAR